MATAMNRMALEALGFLLLREIEFQSLSRRASVGAGQLPEAHASFAIQHGYDRYVAVARGATAADLDRLSQEITPAADTGDVLRATGSLRSILDL